MKNTNRKWTRKDLFYVTFQSKLTLMKVVIMKNAGAVEKRSEVVQI